MAKVDILLPYWGDFGLLKKAVESVLAQTEKDWRLLVFDDCYPSDEARKYFAKLNDERVTYYRHKKNLGITNNFNHALKAAKSDYCVMFGCDDIMLSNYIETALKNIGQATFYQPYVDIIDQNGKVYLPLADRAKRILQPRKSGMYKGEKLATSLCHGNWLYFPSILWKTKTIQKYGFDSKYRIVEDVVLELNLIKDGHVLSFDKTTTFQYRRFSESLSSKEKSKDGVRFREEKEIYDKFTKEFQRIGWSRSARAAKLHITSRIHRKLSN